MESSGRVQAQRSAQGTPLKKPIPFGKYHLLERINVGGMAEVFRAKTFGVEGFERTVAVKRILDNIAEDEEFITMFIDEAKIAVQLQHPNVAQILELGKVDDSYFIAMEFIHGRDMRAIFDHLRKLDYTLPVPQLCYAMMQVCEGLDYAHNKKDAQGAPMNLVHRDVSPQNILLGYEGDVKLVDFGIAKAAGKASKTQAGILKGKFGYMSPEQVRGLPVDRRSDIFSVGICLYEMLTGERLFVGESDFSTLEKVRNVEILPPTSFNSKVPPELERIVLKALARDAEDRFQNAIDLHDDLQAFLYSIGELSSRKDLAAWMRRTFAAEIEEEQNRLKALAGGAEAAPPNAVLEADEAGAVEELAPIQAADDEADDELEWDDDELETQIFDKATPDAGAGVRAAAQSADLEEELTSDDLFISDTSTREMVPVSEDALNEDGFVSDDQTIAQAPSEELLADMGLSPQGPAQAGARAGDQSDEGAPLDETPRADGNLLGYDGALMAGAPTPAVPYHAAVSGGLVPADAVPGDLQQQPGAHATPQPPSAPLGGAAPPLSQTALGQQAAPVAMPHRVPNLPYAKQQAGGGALKYAAYVAVALALGALIVYFSLPRSGTIQLSVAPENAHVVIDETDVNERSVERAPGPYNVIVSAPGYDKVIRAVEVEAGSVSHVEVELRPAADTGFQLRSEPPGALVWLDGKPFTALEDGSGPQVRTNLKADRIAPGPHVLEIRGDDRFEDWRWEFVQEPSKIIPINAILTPRAAATGRRSQRGGAARASKKSVAKTESNPQPTSGSEVSKTQAKPTAGSRKARDSKTPPARESSSGARKTDPRARRETTPADRPPPKRAAQKPAVPPAKDCLMTIGSKPWARVFVDGKDTGKVTPLVNYKLPCGSHRLRLVNTDLDIKKTVRVTVSPDKPFKQLFRLSES